MTEKETIIERPEDNQMKKRVLILLESFKKQGFKEENILDTSNMSIEETAKTILENDIFII